MCFAAVSLSAAVMVMMTVIMLSMTLMTWRVFRGTVQSAPPPPPCVRACVRVYSSGHCPSLPAPAAAAAAAAAAVSRGVDDESGTMIRHQAHIQIRLSANNPTRCWKSAPTWKANLKLMSVSGMTY